MFLVPQNTMVFIRNTKTNSSLTPHFCAHNNYFYVEDIVEDPIKTEKPMYTFKRDHWLMTVPFENVKIA